MDECNNIDECNICWIKVKFDKLHNWPRDFVKCPNCNSLVRERALKYVLDDFTKNLDFKSLKIHESSPSDNALHFYL